MKNFSERFANQKKTNLEPLPSGIFCLSANENKKPESWVNPETDLKKIQYQQKNISNTVYYVLTAEDKRVGQVSFKKTSDSFDIENVYIAESARKKKIATDFLQYLNDKISEQINGDTSRFHAGKKMWESLVREKKAYYESSEKRYKLIK